MSDIDMVLAKLKFIEEIPYSIDGKVDTSEIVKIKNAIKELSALREENERFREALEKIDNWAQAYPLEVFPEPDFLKVRELLEAGGITIDQVSASNMRHVITQVEKITGEALKKANSES